MKEPSPVDPATSCPQPADHPTHLCRLMEQGRTAEVLTLSAHPAFRCGNCGAVADRAEDLCRPGAL